MTQIKKFKIGIANNAYLKESIKVLAGLITEARVQVNKEGIKIVEMDPTNVSLASWDLLPSGCAEYEVPEEFTFGINLNSLLSVLKNLKKNDVLILSNSDKEDDHLSIALVGSITRNYSLPTLGLEDLKEQKIPDLNFISKVVMDSKSLHEQIKECSTVLDTVGFNITKNNLQLSASSDLNNLKMDNKASDSTIISTTEDFLTKYSIEYLLNITKSYKLSDKVIVEFGKDYPIRLTYTAQDYLTLIWILAPRVNND